MASGVKVCDQVKEIFNKMKVVKSTDHEDDRIRLVTLHIDGDIKVETIYTQKEVGESDLSKFLREKMVATECRYFLYDCHYETMEGIKKEELVFILWAPDGAGCKRRMHYASSKNAMDRMVDGVKHNMQINDITDMDNENFAEKLSDKLGKKIHKLEENIVHAR